MCCLVRSLVRIAVFLWRTLRFDDERHQNPFAGFFDPILLTLITNIAALLPEVSSVGCNQLESGLPQPFCPVSARRTCADLACDLVPGIECLRDHHQEK